MGEDGRSIELEADPSSREGDRTERAVRGTTTVPGWSAVRGRYGGLLRRRFDEERETVRSALGGLIVALVLGIPIGLTYGWLGLAGATIAAFAFAAGIVGYRARLREEWFLSGHLLALAIVLPAVPVFVLAGFLGSVPEAHYATVVVAGMVVLGYLVGDTIAQARNLEYTDAKGAWRNTKGGDDWGEV